MEYMLIIQEFYLAPGSSLTWIETGDFTSRQKDVGQVRNRRVSDWLRCGSLPRVWLQITILDHLSVAFADTSNSSYENRDEVKDLTIAAWQWWAETGSISVASARNLISLLLGISVKRQHIYHINKVLNSLNDFLEYTVHKQ